MTLQEIYSTVRTHLLTQNDKALGPLGACVYRTADGRRCAVGCLIPDDIYEPELEGNAYFSGRVIVALKKAGVFVNAEQNIWGLLGDLQQVHDSLSPVEWKDALDNVAGRHNLSTGE
jgi:hypothetical protein